MGMDGSISRVLVLSHRREREKEKERERERKRRGGIEREKERGDRESMREMRERWRERRRIEDDDEGGNDQDRWHWDLLCALRTGQSTRDLHFKHESVLHMSASAGNEPGNRSTQTSISKGTARFLPLQSKT